VFISELTLRLSSPGTTGYGILVDDISITNREAMAEKLEAEVRDNRWDRWQP
jgi:hypothetical protein